MQHEFRLAYRHGDGAAEGFIGTGRTAEEAKADAIDQIQRKIRLIHEDFGQGPNSPKFNPENIIETTAALTKEERDSVLRDIHSGVRY